MIAPARLTLCSLPAATSTPTEPSTRNRVGRCSKRSTSFSSAVAPDEFLFERRDWWVTQIKALGDFYLKAQFGAGPVDYKNYRTTITLNGEKARDNYRQETDTISRLVYGFATAYMLTGDDRYLEGAEKGTEYLREHMRFHDADENIVYWYHGIDVHGGTRG